MNGTSAGLRRWTRRFTIASAGSLVAFLLAILVGGGHRTAVLIGLYGFVCPTIFGMGYLLLPPYVGRTLVDHRLAGVHFVLAYLGVGLLVLGWIRDGIGTLFTFGAILWALGVATFVGSLLVTIGPVLLANPGDVFRFGDRPQRSTGLATATLPVAIGYLLVGTVGLLATASPFEGWSITLSQVNHYYAAGFGALLVYALGARLLIGFYHVTPPRLLVWPTLVFGALAPLLLGTYLWRNPWFRLGGVLETAAMAGYLLTVGFVAIGTDRSRVELSGIVCGALAGAVAVGVALPLVTTGGIRAATTLHWTLVLAGFFPLTIIGYAYQFFPVTGGRFPGATARGAATTIGSLAVGVAVQSVGIVGHLAFVRSAGLAFSVFGALGYLYLMVGRFTD